MVFFNWATMQMAAKIVYYGPGLCGKTTNLSFIYAKTSPNSRGEMVSLETESDRTLFFDLLPIEVGTIGGFKTRLQLYTVPGQVFYNTTRKLVLKGVDGVVFVADSQRPMREANIESFANLGENLAELGLSLEELPVVLQYNKRDLKNILTLDELNADLNPTAELPFHESSAVNGQGVFETLKEVTKLTLKKLRKRMTAPQSSIGPRPVAAPVRPTVPASPANPSRISAAALARAAEEGVEASETEAPPAVDPSGASPELAAATAAQVSEPEAIAHTAESDSALGEPFPSAETGLESDMDAAEAQLEVAEELAEPLEVGSAEALGPADVIDAEEAHEDLTPTTPLSSDGSDPEMRVEFAQSESEALSAEPPPVKRVQVSNQMDILAELDSLRKQATMGPGDRERRSSTPSLDIDALLSGEQRSRELRRRLSEALNSDIFERMQGLHVAIRIQDASGTTIHTLEPFQMSVEEAGSLERLSLQLTLDLENHQ